MEKKDFISPGTAGIAIRVSSKKRSSKTLSVLELNDISPCSQNQY